MARPKDLTTTEPAPTPEEGESGADSTPDERVPAVGQVVAGKYRIESLLGRGGMGVVARGRQLELERPVAIKFLRSKLASDARPLQRFAREARIIAQMRSEHVVRVFDVGREEGVPFIVMELLVGHDLAREIERAPLSVERAVEFMLHACEALGEAHSLGIVHRDVKPSNLFVAEGFGGRESLKVLDFGVSKWLAPAHDLAAPAVTTDGAAIGTPAFASPEQLTRPESIDGRTDVWALGAVLYQALSGKLPFEADTIPSLYSKIISGEPAPFPNGRGVPDALIAVISRCLQRSPADRYPSMLELANALLPFAPARAHAVVDSLATLAAPGAHVSLPETPERALSGRSTTLEFSQVTPPSMLEGKTPAADPKSRQRVANVLWVGLALLLLGAIALWGRTPGGAPTSVTAGSSPAVTGAPASEVVATVPDRASGVAPRASENAPALAPSPSVAVQPPVASVAPPGVRSGAASPGRERALKGAGAGRAAASAAVPAPSASAAASAHPAASATAGSRSDVIPTYRH
jgi:serine/threonine protein kinase